jgi:hypothetical protein
MSLHGEHCDKELPPINKKEAGVEPVSFLFFLKFSNA